MAITRVLIGWAIASVGTRVGRVDGGDLSIEDAYSYEPGGVTETNRRIGVYYYGQLIWGIEP